MSRQDVDHMSEPDSQTAWEVRALCPDGNCLGVLDASGQCRLCRAQGQPGPGVAPTTAARLPGDESDAASDEPSADVAAPVHSAAVDRTAETDEDSDDRELCREGACLGVLDRHGRCHECGQSWLIDRT